MSCPKMSSKSTDTFPSHAPSLGAKSPSSDYSFSSNDDVLPSTIKVCGGTSSRKPTGRFQCLQLAIGLFLIVASLIMLLIAHVMIELDQVRMLVSGELHRDSSQDTAQLKNEIRGKLYVPLLKLYIS